MKVLAFNGSPRKNWNTWMLLDAALQGAKSKDAEVELINLYDLTYKGCVSCFACKRKGNEPDTCVLKDDLLPVFQKICESDAIVLGSPIYFGSVTGEMRSFMERLFFPYISYDRQPPSFKKKINAALIYTMNAPESHLTEVGYDKRFAADEALMKRVFGSCEKPLLSTETYQFDDYSKYAASMFDIAQRAERRETVFKEDCKKAFALGERLVVV